MSFCDTTHLSLIHIPFQEKNDFAVEVHVKDDKLVLFLQIKDVSSEKSSGRHLTKSLYQTKYDEHSRYFADSFILNQIITDKLF